MKTYQWLIAATGLILLSPGLSRATPRPLLISGGAEGSLKVEKDPRYSDFLYYSSPSGSEVRVWAGKGRVVKPGDPPLLNKDDYTELMYILEGSVTLAEPGGPDMLLKAGDMVIAPRGVPYYWRLPTGQWVKKVYVVFDQGKGAPALPYRHLIRLDPHITVKPGSKEATRTSQEQTYYESRGNGAGVWQTKPYTGRSGFKPKNYSEMMFFLKGEGTLDQKDGSSLTFKAGDVVLVPKGAAYQWKSKDVLKYWLTFDEETTSTR